MKQKGLGKGLNALLSEEVIFKNKEEGVKKVPILEVEPNFEQPRKSFSEEELLELSLSIKQHGILQPLIVRKKEDKYQIIAGERRYRAARMAKLDELPVLVKDLSDQETLEVSLIENIQREDLNSMELAYAYSLLMDRFELTQEQVAEKVGKSRSSVTNIMRLLQLTPYVQQKLRDQEISFGHARAILSIKETNAQKQLTDYIILKQLSVRETEKYIQNLSQTKEVKKKEPINVFYREIQESLQQVLGTKVMISKGKNKGKIEIEYYSDEELERIIEMIHTK
jgi:ParB family chromosome partitioning protein